MAIMTKNVLRYNELQTTVIFTRPLNGYYALRVSTIKNEGFCLFLGKSALGVFVINFRLSIHLGHLITLDPLALGGYGAQKTPLAVGLGGVGY